jgi:hypothetical protein
MALDPAATTAVWGEGVGKRLGHYAGSGERSARHCYSTWSSGRTAAQQGPRSGLARRPWPRPPVVARRRRLATGASSPGGADRGQAGHGLEQTSAQRRARRPRGPVTARTRRAARLPPSAGGPAGQAERLGKARTAPRPGRGLKRGDGEHQALGQAPTERRRRTARPWQGRSSP